MKILDLGVLDTPLLLFGGPYSNLQASEALLEFARQEGFAPTNVICTGDLVAYCAQPAETIKLFRDFGGPILAGNCEKQLAANALDCGCGFEDGTACDLLSAGWYAHANQQVGAEDRRWMAELPDLMRFEHVGKTYGVVHGGAMAINRFLWQMSPDSEFQEEFELLSELLGDVDTVVSGHSGIAFERQVAGKTWINAGAIGLPRNDGQRSTEFVTLTDGAVNFHCLQYNSAEAYTQMNAAGLTQGYHQTLKTGYWPSEDVLPPEMRRNAIP